MSKTKSYYYLNLREYLRVSFLLVSSLLVSLLQVIFSFCLVNASQVNSIQTNVSQVKQTSAHNELVQSEHIKAEVSSEELNRIVIPGDRISEVFGLSEKFLLETEDQQGQIFIRPITNKPFNITVVTEKGITQDLLLVPKKINSKTITLKNPNISNTKALKWETSKPYTQTLVNLIQLMASNIIVGDNADISTTGYTTEELNEPILLWKDLNIRKIKSYKGNKLEGIIYELKNLSSETKLLAEKAFLESLTASMLPSNIAAISLFSRKLNPGETTRLFLIRRSYV